MAEYDQIKEFRVFLASPSDLNRERELASTAASDINEILREQGWCVRLIVWEDVPPGTGRAQELINKYADQCQLFVGLLWRHWGSKPAADTKFKSGFEEEYSRADALRAATGTPEMWMYFKEIPAEFLEDPGMSLKRVQRFRRNYEKQFSGKYQTFSDPSDWRAKFSKHLLRHILNIIREERGEKHGTNPEAPLSNTAVNSTPPALSEDAGYSKETSLLISRVGLHLAEDGFENKLSKLDKARFSIVAVQLAKDLSNENFLDTHTGNILYLHREELNAGWRERYVLIRSAINSYQDRTFPLWYWMSGALIESALTLTMHALRDRSESIRQKSIDIMTEFSFEPDEEFVGRADFFATLLDGDVSKEIRLACIHLLGKIGRIGEVDFLKAEIAKNISETRSPAEAALLYIMARDSKTLALKVALSGQLSIGSKLDSLGEALSNIDAASLELGLNHKESDVRATCARELAARNALTEELFEKLLQDGSPSVRKQALLAKIDRGQNFDRDTLNKLMSKGEKQSALSLFNTFDSVDVNEVDNLLILQLSRLPDETLRTKLSWFKLNPELIYWVLAAKHEIAIEQVRSDLNDNFTTFFEDSYEKLLKEYGPSQAAIAKDAIAKYGEQISKRLCRAAARFLCLNGDETDLLLVRKHINKETMVHIHIDAKRDAIYYFGCWGDASDLQLILHISSGGLLSPSLFPNDPIAAEAVKSICGRDLLSALADPNVTYWLGKLISIAPIDALKRLPPETLNSLFTSDITSVRASISQRWFPTLTPEEIPIFIADYTKSGHYYYNVLYWADVMAFAPKQMLEVQLPTFG